MDAATAAIIGAAVGFTGAIAAAWINPFSTAKHAREAKRLELRREAYAAGIAVLEEITDVETPDDYRRMALKMIVPLSTMRLVGSADVARLYEEIGDVVHRWGTLAVPAVTDGDAFGADLEGAIDAFIEAAREDIATGD